jgi:hypothetical protein
VITVDLSGLVTVVVRSCCVVDHPSGASKRYPPAVLTTSRGSTVLPSFNIKAVTPSTPASSNATIPMRETIGRLRRREIKVFIRAPIVEGVVTDMTAGADELIADPRWV